MLRYSPVFHRAVVISGALATAACGPPPPPLHTEPVAARIVASERGKGGVVLVLVSEHGERLADITEPPLEHRAAFVVDTQPAWSPDGKWIAFASTRGSDGKRTHLWLVPARAEAEPVQLTSGDAMDRDPAWSPDGKSLVFSSNRSGSFDLWRLDVGVPAGPGNTPTRLTSAATDEVSPAVSPNGRRLAYAVFDAKRRLSNIWVSDASGMYPEPITVGPLDQSPAWSPDGERIAYTAPAKTRTDLELFTVRPDGTRERHVSDEPLAHEIDPAWSADGRFLFATAVLRSESTGAPFFWSTVFVDMTDPARPVRALHDPVAVPRVAFALAPSALDDTALIALPLYDREAVLAALRAQCGSRAGDRLEACERLLRESDPAP